MSTQAHCLIARRTRLVACISAALAFAFPDAQAGDAADRRTNGADQLMLDSSLGLRKNTRTRPAKHSLPNHPSSTWTVDTCADDGSPGSLRARIYAAMSGDTIDLSQLACSTITLDASQTPPHIEVNQDTLYLKGPNPGSPHVTIDGGSHSSVFTHFGTGKLDISDLTISHASYISSNYALGGCIYSSGSVILNRSVVSHCGLSGTAGYIPAAGGGIFAKGDVTLSFSTVTDSHVSAVPVVGTTIQGYAFGGGIFCQGYCRVKYSTVSHSSAWGGFRGMGGGAFTYGNVLIGNSTFSGNYSRSAAGIKIAGPFAGNRLIINSTISGNNVIASTNYGDHSGGISASVPITIANSTIAFNFGNYAPGYGIVSEEALTLYSSIVAGNFSRDYGPGDLAGSANAVVTAPSSNNLIISSTLPLPGDTIRDCPQLQPLADNGGPTRTHALRHMSPALDAGSNPQDLTTDQRGAHRVVGATVDVGSVEWQVGEADEQFFTSGFDGLCDR